MLNKIQEAYKSSEDLYTIFQLSRDIEKKLNTSLIRQSLLAKFYENLATVFWKCGNPLYHAAALVKVLLMHVEQKKKFEPKERTLYVFDCSAKFKFTQLCIG